MAHNRFFFLSFFFVIYFIPSRYTADHRRRRCCNKMQYRITRIRILIIHGEKKSKQMTERDRAAMERVQRVRLNCRFVKNFPKFCAVIVIIIIFSFLPDEREYVKSALFNARVTT